MQFVSLANSEDNVSFQEALQKGVPENGSSLYVPEHIPQLSEEDLARLPDADGVEIGKIMLRPYLEDEVSGADLDEIVREAVTFPTPLRDVGDKKVLELYHGPTLAFKDVAARYLASLTGFFNRREGRKATVAVATSGDTGGAVAEGFADVEGTQVVVLYPKGKVSKLQQEQLRRVATNILSLEVDGTFQDCLSLSDTLFADRELKEELNLTTANSINVGRWIPQTTYYASAVSQLGGIADRRIAVPVGNEGNISSGLLGSFMGLNIPGFTGGNNRNNALSQYLETGIYRPVYYGSTMSSAMDVEDPRNHGRFDWLFGGKIDYMRSMVRSSTVTDAETAETIKEVYEDNEGYLLDPHTAVAWRASGDGNDVVVATAAGEKFAEEIEVATGIEVDNSYQLRQLRQRPERYVEIGNSAEELLEALDTIR